MTQEQLARALLVTRQSVYMWESGKTAPPSLLDLAMRCMEYERGLQGDPLYDAFIAGFDAGWSGRSNDAGAAYDAWKRESDPPAP